MRRKIIGFIITLIIITIFISPFIMVGIGINYMECKAKAKALGYKADYGIIQGCVLEKPNGKRILLEQLRDIGD